jgi:hypothetical protein
MSDLDVKATLKPKDKKQSQWTVTIKGKMSQEEWAEFQECLRTCLRRFEKKFDFKVKEVKPR